MNSVNSSILSNSANYDAYYAQQYYSPQKTPEAFALQQKLDMMKAEMQQSKMEVMMRFLQYKNEYISKQPEIVDSKLYDTYARNQNDVQSFSIAEQMKKETGELDPSKIILKLCQICYRGSHKFNPQEQGNKKLRVVEFLLNNKILFKFQFECANNKIANRATAYEAIYFLFPGVYTLMLYDLFKNTDPYEFLSFQSQQSSIRKEDVREKKATDIYAREFDCNIISIERIDKSDKMAGFTTKGHNLKALDTSFTKKVTSKMFSTLANTMLQKVAGRSLNFDAKLNKKVAASNTLDGDGKNEYSVTASDNQANKYFTMTVICQNKSDAKAICGLKFIELHAEEVFIEIWNELLQGVPYPKKTSQSLNSSDGSLPHDSTNLFSQVGDYDDMVKSISPGPPGLGRLNGTIDREDSRLESFRMDSGGFGFNHEFSQGLMNNTGSFSNPGSGKSQPRIENKIAPFGGESLLKVSVRKDVFPMNQLLIEEEPEQEDIPEDRAFRTPQLNLGINSNESQFQKEKLEKEIGHLIDDTLDDKPFKSTFKGLEPIPYKTKEKPEQEKEKISGYQFFPTDAKLTKSANPGSKSIQGGGHEQRKESPKDSDEDDDDGLSKDSDLKDDDRSKDYLGESESISSRSSRIESGDFEEDTQDSIERILDDYIEHIFKPQGELSVRKFPESLPLKLKRNRVFPSLIDCSFTFKINDLLEDAGLRIIQYPLLRDDANFKIRFILEKKEDNGDFKALEYADLHFTSSNMDFEFSSNYGVYLIIKRVFPQMIPQIMSKTLRSVIGLTPDEKDSSFMVKSMPIFSQKATYARTDDINLSSITNPKVAANLLGQSMMVDTSLLGTKSVHKDLQTTPFQKETELFLEQRALTSSAGRGQGQDLSQYATSPESFSFSFNFVKLIEDYTKINRVPDKSRNPTDYEEVLRWGRIPEPAFFFGQKLITMESWELMDVFYHQDLAKRRSEHNSFEQKIKKKETFYANVKKNLMDEDYASVLNSLIHTIFKEAMKFNHENNLTSFSLMNKVLVVMHARVQNIKLRNKLASMVVLRLLWKEFYERCTTGDLAKKEP